MVAWKSENDEHIVKINSEDKGKCEKDKNRVLHNFQKHQHIWKGEKYWDIWMFKKEYENDQEWEHW